MIRCFCHKKEIIRLFFYHFFPSHRLTVRSLPPNFKLYCLVTTVYRHYIFFLFTHSVTPSSSILVWTTDSRCFTLLCLYACIHLVYPLKLSKQTANKKEGSKKFKNESHPTHSYIWFCFCCGTATQRGSWPPHSWGILDHTQWRITVGGTPLDEWSAHRRDLYLTTHNTHNRQTSMTLEGFELTIPAGERPQTYALDRKATGNGSYMIYFIITYKPT